jgi:hypothetical protein
LHGLGSRLVVHVVDLPSPDTWRAEAERLGVRFEPDAPRLRAGLQSVSVRDVASHATLSLAVESSADVDWTAEVDDATELAALQRTRWSVHIALPQEMPDRLPSALAVSLAAAGDGVCYHAGMDRSVFGADARSMMARLCAEEQDDAVIAQLVQLVRESVGVPIDTDALAELFRNVRVTHSAAATYAANLHVWLEGQPSTRAFARSDGWPALLARLEELLARDA